MHFLLKGPFGDVEQKTCWLQLLSACLYLLLSKFSNYFTCLNLIVTPITLYFRLNINMKLLQMCICGKQRFSFNRIYKYKRSKD